MLHILSTGVMAILAAGMYFRGRRPSIHWKLMVTAFVIDVGLVLYIELTRKAIEQIPQARGLLLFHIAVSLSVIVCYLVMFALGRRLLGGRLDTRIAHRNVGFTFLTLRSLNYVTSFLV
jgi:hypothetical protein